MKIKLKRIISGFVSLVVVSTIFIPQGFMNAKAIWCAKDGFDKSRYTLSGNMAEDAATIAKSQEGRFCDDFGYSGVDWGAWCDEYVADCLENAGCDSSIVGHGGTVANFARVMRGKGAIEVTSPQTGDLAFFNWSHVEIVTKVVDGRVYTAGGNNNDPNTKKYHDGGCCAGEHETTNSIRYYLRPNYTNVPLDAPILSINKNAARTDEEIYISWNDVKEADSYWLHIYKNGEDYINQSLDKALSFTHTYPKGNYTAYVVSIRGSVEALSYVSFSVYDSLPAAPQPHIVKDHFEIKEMVDITWADVPETDYYWLHIYRNGEDYENKSLDKALSYSAQYPEGEYRAYIVSGNGLGETLSYVDFTVHSDPPDKPDLRIAKNRFTINEDVTVSWDAIANADSYWLHSYRNGEDYENKSIGTDLSYTAQYPVGEYTLFIVPINAAGETLSSVDFTVHDSKPEAPKPTIPKSSFSTDERINIKWNKTTDTDSYWLHIYKDGEDYVNQSLMLSLDYSAKYPAGNYTAYIVSCNAIGETLSSVDFSVYVNGDCNSDGEFNISDVLLLQKWLLVVPDTHMENWQAADLCEDDRLDVFDLCLMKRQLIYGSDNK